MNSRHSFSALMLSTMLAGVSCGGDETGTTTPPPPTICDMIEDYTASTTTPLTFTTDIQPIIMSSLSCGLVSQCHGSSPVTIDAAMMKTFSYVGDPMTVRTSMLAPSVNAPTLANVVPGQVGQSFLAYKLSGVDGLRCLSSRTPSACVDGASTGTETDCGDDMPSMPGGTLSAADRTKILDWIAQGAAL
jgi:hypothetical protein